MSGGTIGLRAELLFVSPIVTRRGRGPGAGPSVPLALGLFGLPRLTLKGERESYSDVLRLASARGAASAATYKTGCLPDNVTLYALRRNMYGLQNFNLRTSVPQL